MRRLESFSGSSFQATYGYQLASASYGTGFSCCREFKFQYNGLQYELAPQAAKLSLLGSQVKGKTFFTIHAANNG